MSKQLALLSSGTAALAMIAAPALAQDTVVDDRYSTVSEGAVLADDLGDGWEDEVSAGATYVTDGESIYIDEDLDSGVVYETYERGAQRTVLPQAMRTVALRPAYSNSQRDQWLAQCRAVRSEYDQPYEIEEEDDSNGGLLGGILGAIVGGVVGNRVADGNRLLGTVAGAGLGGAAGAVIGSALDDDEEESFGTAGNTADYCEAYLTNYERGYGLPGQTVLAQAPTAYVQRPQISRVIMVEDVPVNEQAPVTYVEEEPPLISRSIPAS